MEVDPVFFGTCKQKAQDAYAARSSIYCPYFKAEVILNSDGFHHLQFSARRERNKSEQLVKFRLLPQALEVIHKSGTVQEYRRMLSPIGKPSKKDGAVPMKMVEYWGFVAIVGEKRMRIRVIARREGTGNITVWSVMFHSKMKDGKQRLHDQGLEDEEA